MAGISAKDVKALRDSTGAGMMDCKKALSEAEGDVEKAMEILRASGLAKAGKRAGRETSGGRSAPPPRRTSPRSARTCRRARGIGP